jgi:hypothetical protein
MADNQQPGGPKPGMNENLKPRQGKDQPVVGQDVPDESKERHTEIAVEAGQKVGGTHDEKK